MIYTSEICELLEGTFWRAAIERCSICGDVKPCLENCESVDFNSTMPMFDPFPTVEELSTTYREIFDNEAVAALVNWGKR